jgi:DNA-directed RNA polymerase specialized sigma24 family protein
MSNTDGHRACEEVSILGHRIARELRSPSEGPRGASLVRALEASLGDDPSAPRDAMRFVARWISDHDGGQHRVDRLGNRAAFLWLTLRASGALAGLVRAAARKAYRGTAGTLQPFVEEEDFFELVRWRLWRVPTSKFDAEGILRPSGLAGFLATVCRHLAIDQIRRLAKLQADPLRDDPDAWTQASGADLETQIATYEEIDRAFRIAGDGHPPWLVRGVAAVLSESRDRLEVLEEINRERERAGEAPWTAGAFNTFLYRFRRSLREALRGG